jgi:hypothetical protein
MDDLKTVPFKAPYVDEIFLSAISASDVLIFNFLALCVVGGYASACNLYPQISHKQQSHFANGGMIEETRDPGVSNIAGAGRWSVRAIH